MNRPGRLTSLSLLAAGALMVMPAEARACGGTFCDTGPQTMPVDQTGENVLFIIDGDEVEAHIQIRYDPDTDAAKFAWMIPMPSLPSFAVGSEALFTALLNFSVPTYGLNSVGQCNGGTGGGGTFIIPSDAGGNGDSGPPPDPMVLYEGAVGAFDVVVLAGEDVGGLMQWLMDNDYQADPNAEPILQQYLDEGNVIVAFKLSTGEGLDAIHPVVLRYSGVEGCVPIRLTRIAAVDDMDIRVFVLGDARTVPLNYRHVLVNPLKIDWLNLGANYKEVVSMAVDAFAAEGRAFVTEYAGTSEGAFEMLQFSLYWDAQAFVGLDPTAVIDELTGQLLVQCVPGQCLYFHPLIPALLAQYLPVPDGLDADEFYSCVECYAGQVDQAAWDMGMGFAVDFDERVVQPGYHAATLLTTWPYLTRMYTTISPNEMTEDPEFVENPDLGDVANVRVAQIDNTCDQRIVTLPDGRQVFLDPGEPWPQFQAEMPWEEDVDEMPPKGAPQPLVDNTALIDKLLAEWNQSGGETAGTGGSSGGGTGGETTAGATVTGDVPTGDAPTGGGGSSSTGETAGTAGDGGCGCRGASEAPWWCVLAAPALARRRRAR